MILLQHSTVCLHAHNYCCCTQSRTCCLCSDSVVFTWSNCVTTASTHTHVNIEHFVHTLSLCTVCFDRNSAVTLNTQKYTVKLSLISIYFTHTRIADCFQVITVSQSQLFPSHNCYPVPHSYPSYRWHDLLLCYIDIRFETVISHFAEAQVQVKTRDFVTAGRKFSQCSCTLTKT